MRKSLLFFFISIFSFSVQAQFGVLSLSPTADARCEGGTSADTNYGSETSIRAKFNSDASSTYNRKSFIKFNLTGVNTSNIGQVKIGLYPSLIQGSNYSINLYQTSSAWEENTITNNNAPVFGNLITEFPCGAQGVLSEIDVTNFAITKLATTAELSFGLYNSVMSGTNQILWNSKEAASNQPFISIVFKAKKPSTFTSTVLSGTQLELSWDTTGCNATKYIIDRKLTDGEYVNLATIDTGAIPKFVDNTYNSENSYTYRIVAINPGLNAEPFELKVIGASPMVYSGSICTQFNVSSVLPASLNNPILRLKIDTQNDLSPLKLTSIAMNMLGTTDQNDVAGISVFYTRTDSNFVNPKPFGVTKKQPFAENIEISGNQTLLPGPSYFWICYNTSATAKFENKLDAQCVSITINSSDVKIPTVTSPAGNRKIDFLTTNVRLPDEVISSTTPYAGTNVVSFSQNVIASYKGYQYAAYWNETKQVAVARKRIAGGNWEVAILSDYTSTNDLTDNHYNISMGLCTTDGTFHISYDHHAHNLNYRRSVVGLIENPEDFQWSASNFLPNQENLYGSSAVTQVTYPRFITKPNGDMLLELRKGGSGNGDAYLWEYSGASHSWTSIGRYINGISDSQNAYLHGIQYDHLGRLHAAWCWRQTSAPETNHDLYYTFSEDDGRTWKNTNGVSVGTSGTNPLRLATTGLKVWTIPQNRSLMNQESMCIDTKGRVHVLNGYIKDNEPDVAVWGTSYPVHFYRDEAGVWHRNFMLLETKKNRDQIACDANNNIYLVLENNIYMATEISAWTDWKVVAQKGSATSGDGAIDKEKLLKENVLSIASGASSNRLMQINYLIDNLSTGSGNGLTTNFFNSTDFQNKIISTADNIDFDWGAGSPAANVQVDNFSGRFYGKLETRFAEQYTLYLTTSEKVVCKINGSLVVNAWNNTSTNEFTITLPLIASHKYDIEIASAFTDKPAAIKLEWSSARQPRSIVPKSALYAGEKESTLTEIRTINSNSFKISAFPNPTKGLLTINIQNNNSEITDLTIVNLMGQVSLTERFQSNGSFEKQLDLSQFSKGIYFLKVTANNRQLTQKIIVD